METAVNYVDDGEMFFSSDEVRWINKIRKLAEEHPDTVKIIHQPEDNHGCIYARIVEHRWLKISPPRKVEYSDEQREKMAARMKNINDKSRNGEE